MSVDLFISFRIFFNLFNIGDTSFHFLFCIFRQNSAFRSFWGGKQDFFPPYHFWVIKMCVKNRYRILLILTKMCAQRNPWRISSLRDFEKIPFIWEKDVFQPQKRKPLGASKDYSWKPLTVPMIHCLFLKRLLLHRKLIAATDSKHYWFSACSSAVSVFFFRPPLFASLFFASSKS